MSPCKPSKPTFECASCARFNPGLSDLPDVRRIVAIDASVVRRDERGRCQFLEPVRPRSTRRAA